MAKPSKCPKKRVSAKKSQEDAYRLPDAEEFASARTDILRIIDRLKPGGKCTYIELFSALGYPSERSLVFVTAIDQLRFERRVLEQGTFRISTPSENLSSEYPLDLFVRSGYWLEPGIDIGAELDALRKEAPDEMPARVKRDVLWRLNEDHPLDRPRILLGYPQKYHRLANRVIDHLLSSRELGRYTDLCDEGPVEMIFVSDESERLPEWWTHYEAFDVKSFFADNPYIAKLPRTSRGRYLKCMGLRSHRQKWYQPLGRYPEYRLKLESVT